MKTLSNADGRFAKIWVKEISDVEDSALEMIKTMLEFPDLAGHIAIMPDTHMGVGAVIGGVVATRETVVPNIVGVDIGCGMSAFCTGIKIDEIDNTQPFWKEFGGRVKREVPMGFNSHLEPQQNELTGTYEYGLLKDDERAIFDEKGVMQIGTLGGGNHFMEAQVDENGIIWFMIHSGSRNMGLRFADKYNKVAQDLNEKMFSVVPKDLWFLPMDSIEGRSYFNAMTFATKYALENRWRMLEQMAKAFDPSLVEAVRKTGVNIHHNFAALETHEGKTMVVHRKGATVARDNVVGIIPGSMGSNSYIVRGTNNEESYTSCSHGAGRRMSRRKASETITEADFSASIAETFSSASMKYIDEAPGAYKNIDEVMDNQKDLVNIVHTLKPIYTLKAETKNE